MQRRTFVKGAAVVAAAGALGVRPALASSHTAPSFDGMPGVFPGDRWEGLNLGYWREDIGGLRRVTRAMGDRVRVTGFPYHYKTHTERGSSAGQIDVNYDPSQPLGVMWSRKTRMDGTVECRLEFTVEGLTQPMREGDDPAWQMYQDWYGLVGLSVGASSQFEGHFPSQDASPILAIRANGEFGLVWHRGGERFSRNDPRDGASDPDPLIPVEKDSVVATAPLREGESVALILVAHPLKGGGMALEGMLERGGTSTHVAAEVPPGRGLGDHVGIAARGLLDVTVNKFAVTGATRTLNAPVNDCHTCYALGDTLKRVGDRWQVRMVSMFRSPGEVEIRVSDSERPRGGWASIPVAGRGMTISDDIRRDTALIDVILPRSPAETELYYTVWKDGTDVTADPRIGTDSCGPGTGLIGDIPGSGNYVGRLPRLAAPYRLCGLSCHAVSTEFASNLPDDGKGRGRRGITAANWVHDQPTRGAFERIEEFDYQIMLWDDDVWYMELLQYPPSTDDAFKVVTLSICGPTSRWQMMRHWNVLNGGDHDFGMDDVKGPEQIVLRKEGGLGQDPDYLKRNFGIESLLMRGVEMEDLTSNPERWRKWRMPNGDFALLVTDARLWRTSQYSALWDEAGWPHDNHLYERQDPTRTLLGEAQFAWLTEQIRTEAAPLICVTGLNCLHTVFDQPDGGFDTDNRVAADYAGWVTAGTTRVLELFAERGGVVSVGGDLHLGTVMENADLNILESIFGPIGRYGGRKVKPDFGPDMIDNDGRRVLVHSFYHQDYADPSLAAPDPDEPMYWNVLDGLFDPREHDPVATLTIRNIVDGPDSAPRGGGNVVRSASGMGVANSRLPQDIRMLPDADVLVLSAGGTPLRATRTGPDGLVKLTTLRAEPQEVLLVARAGRQSETVAAMLEEVGA